MELPPADIDCDHVAAPPGQKDLGKTAGRGAKIKASSAGWINAKDIECVCQLQAAARHPGVGRRPGNRRAGRNQLAWLSRCLSGNHNISGLNRRPRLGP